MTTLMKSLAWGCDRLMYSTSSERISGSRLWTQYSKQDSENNLAYEWNQNGMGGLCERVNTDLTSRQGKRKKSSRKPQGPKKVGFEILPSVLEQTNPESSVSPSPRPLPASSAITRKRSRSSWTRNLVLANYTARSADKDFRPPSTTSPPPLTSIQTGLMPAKMWRRMRQQMKPRTGSSAAMAPRPRRQVVMETTMTTTRLIMTIEIGAQRIKALQVFGA
jgi:hypothetical protein